MSRTTSPKAIRRKLFPWICAVLLALYPHMAAYALTPTVSPSPAASPTPYARPIMESFDVQLLHDGTWSSLKKEMRALHEDGIYADGILMFMHLRDFVEQGQWPCVELSEDFTYQVMALDPGVSLDYSHTVYNQAWEVVLFGEDPALDWNRLEPGKYLVLINVYAKDSDRYANTSSLFWLIVDDDDAGEAPMSWPTPTISPAPMLNSTTSDAILNLKTHQTSNAFE